LLNEKKVDSSIYSTHVRNGYELVGIDCLNISLKLTNCYIQDVTISPQLVWTV